MCVHIYIDIYVCTLIFPTRLKWVSRENLRVHTNLF